MTSIIIRCSNIDNSFYDIILQFSWVIKDFADGLKRSFNLTSMGFYDRTFTFNGEQSGQRRNSFQSFEPKQSKYVRRSDLNDIYHAKPLCKIRRRFKL